MTSLTTLGSIRIGRFSVLLFGDLFAFWRTYTEDGSGFGRKIFLRTDLFQRFATEGGPDLAIDCSQ
jgi:hypothetical protein